MKKLIDRFNWKNFLQRTLLFLFVFILIRLLVDWVQGDVSFLRILRLSLVRYLAFALVFGLLDSETWHSTNKESESEQQPIVFQSFFAGLFHYTGVAFFIALLCGVILLVFFFLQWMVNYFSGKSQASLFPDWPTYLLVIAIIGICFAAFDAIRNYMRLQKRR